MKDISHKLQQTTGGISVPALVATIFCMAWLILIFYGLLYNFGILAITFCISVAVILGYCIYNVFDDILENGLW